MRISDRFELFVLPFDLISMALFISLVIELTRLQGEAGASRRLAASPAAAPQIPET